MTKEKVVDELGASPNPAQQNLKALEALFPEAFSEGRLDVEAMKRTLGEESIIEGGERYRLDWAGKSDAYKVLQTPTTATLRPERDKSVNFDTAQHVFIEGENLEVLKVIQKAYFGKVNLIYIDPPYNTGNDSFIYPDRFQESKDEYLKRINQLDDDGTLMREGFFRKNSRENGHYHSNWLNMMLPRLYVARNLLASDGAIFVSCDDNEVHNLRCLMNEIFGEENFLCTFAWQKRYAPPPDTTDFGYVHESIIAFRKSERFTRNLLPISEAQRGRYKNPDNDERGDWKPADLTCRYTADERPTLYYPIMRPADGAEIWPKRTRVWSASKDVMAVYLEENRLWWGANGLNDVPALKNFVTDIQQGMMPTSFLSYEVAGHTDEATKELRELVPELSMTPKPTKLMKHLMAIGASDGDLVMDFFAGSGTLCHAAMEVNVEQGRNLSTMSVYFPESLAEDGEAFKAGFRTIADAAFARVTRVSEKLQQAFQDEPLQGVKKFTLSPSNFRQWRGDAIDDGSQLAEQISMFVKSDKEGAEVESILYELLLRSGQELTSAIEQVQLDSHRAYVVSGNKQVFVLYGFSEEMIDPIVDLNPGEVIALDSVFSGLDELKTNLELQCRDAGIKFTCV